VLVSADRPLAQTGSPESGLIVRVRFMLEDEDAARRLSAQLIDRAHELANLPECECDLDVDVQWSAAPAPSDGAPPLGPAPESAPDR
jgi:hypothetical protein